MIEEDLSLLKQIVLSDIMFFGGLIIADIDEDTKFNELKQIDTNTVISLFSRYAEIETLDLLKIVKDKIEENSEDIVEFIDRQVPEIIDKIINKILLVYNMPKTQTIII